MTTRNLHFELRKDGFYYWRKDGILLRNPWHFTIDITVFDDYLHFTSNNKHAKTYYIYYQLYSYNTKRKSVEALLHRTEGVDLRIMIYAMEGVDLVVLDNNKYAKACAARRGRGARLRQGGREALPERRPMLWYIILSYSIV